MEVFTFIGILIGFLTLGMELWHQAPSALLVSPISFLFIIGGALSALFLSTTSKDIKNAIFLLPWFFKKYMGQDPRQIFTDLITASRMYKKDSPQVLLKYIENFKDPFLIKILKYLVSQTHPDLIYDIFVTEISQKEKNWFAGIKVWLQLGHYCALMGLLNALLLIGKYIIGSTELTQLSQLISSAFISTSIGLILAYFIFFPIANKLKRKAQERVNIKEMILEGCIGISHEINSVLLEQKLSPYLEKRIL